MNPDELAYGFLEYVVFLLSTTCHEASHSLVAKLGGDMTASEGGQVTLNPIPHIRREPFGMVVMPLLGIITQVRADRLGERSLRPPWSQKHPKRAAWMSLAGPGANFSICLLAAILMRIGLAMKFLTPGTYSMGNIVGPATPDSVAEGIATILSVFFSLNLLLGCFNLLPIPPLDGYGVLGLFTSEAGALKLQEMRLRLGWMSLIGMVLAWRFLSYFYDPLMKGGIDLMYLGYQ